MKKGEVWILKNKDEHLEVIDELGQQIFLNLFPEIRILKIFPSDYVGVEIADTDVLIGTYPRQFIIDYYERNK